MDFFIKPWKVSVKAEIQKWPPGAASVSYICSGCLRDAQEAKDLFVLLEFFPSPVYLNFC